MAGDETMARGGWVRLMLLADGRFPSGSHAYSAGMEQAVVWGDVSDLASAEAFVTGRLETSAVLAAQVTAAANEAARTAASGGSASRATSLLDELDRELDARTASAAARVVSREVGRRWRRAVVSAWPDLIWLEGDRARHGWVVLGSASAPLGISPEEASCLALYELAGAPVWAAVRLLGLDPMAAAGLVARMVTEYEAVVCTAAREAVGRMDGTGEGDANTSDRWAWVSWSTALLSELAAEAHPRREDRLFAS